MADWTWDPSRNEREAYREFKQMAEEFIEMNGSGVIRVNDLTVLWYLRGLGDQYATLRDTVMNSDATLNEQYVLRRIEDLRRLREPAEKASWIHQKGIKCFACKRIGRCAKDCPSRREHDYDNASGGTVEGGKGRRNGRNSKPCKRTMARQKGRSAENHDEGSFGEVSDADEQGALASEEIVEHVAFIKEENAYRANEDLMKWCSDSGATSMCTEHWHIFKYINPTYRGTLTIASGARIPIEGRGIVKFSLPNGSRARLGGVIYVPGLAENLLSLEALHLAGFESRGSMREYELMKGGER